MLWVSDQPGYARDGGMVELQRRGARIGLVVNLPALESAGLKASSKLLQLSDVIRSGAMAFDQASRTLDSSSFGRGGAFITGVVGGLFLLICLGFHFRSSEIKCSIAVLPWQAFWRLT